MNFEKKENKKDFIEKKKIFFSQLGLQLREQLKLHINYGLWDKEDSWKNISEHCLVEVARCNVLSEKIKLNDQTKDKLKQSAILHDFYKKKEIMMAKNQDKNFETFSAIYAQATEELKNAGVPNDIIALINSVGHAAISEIEKILKKQELSDQDIAMLIMHYVDDYTIGSDWSKNSEINNQGKIINDLDRRMEKNIQNPNYQLIHEQGKKYFSGIPTYTKQLEIGNQVEQKLTEIINKINNTNINPKDLPIYIDEQIKEKINSIE